MDTRTNQVVWQARCARAFSIVELLAALLVVGVIIIVLLPLTVHSTRCGAPFIKDATQIRGVVQGCMIWSENNGGAFPLPSRVDLRNVTVAEEGRAKDTSANIVSMMIWNGLIPPEMVVSPAEANERIRMDEDYAYGEPKAAVTPGEALWDPAYGADFTNGHIGNLSYGLLETSGTTETGRLPRWSERADPAQAVLGNRGPRISAVTYDAKGRGSATVANPMTKTYRIHGARTSWEGNIGFNDGHVDFETMLVPAEMPYFTTSAGALRQDCPYFDEPGDVARSNAYLGIFIKSGERGEDFVAIWD